jgi:chromosome partitioning protein
VRVGRIVAVTNIKGGIGKTTTVVNVGAGLAHLGARVLLVDVDAQGNLAMALGVTPARTIYDVLVDGAPVERCIISARPDLDLLAADDSLLMAQPLISRRTDWSRVLDYVLQPLKRDYDYILIDSPGSLTVLSVNALRAASEVLVPTTVEHLSIKGLSLLFKQVSRVTAGSSKVRMIVPTMFDARLNQAKNLLAELQQNYGTLVATPVRINVKLSEAASLGRTIYEHDPHSRGAVDYANLVKCLHEAWKSGEVKKATLNLSPEGKNGSTAEVPAPSGDEPLTTSGTLPLPPTTPAEAPPPHAEKKSHMREKPLVSGNGALPLTCPHCGQLLRRATVAGYRVAYCDNCKYKQQELVSGVRR